MYQTYMRKLGQIENRYPDMAPKAILKKLLGSDTTRDEEQVLSSRSAPPVTGEQGGRLLACYLYSLELAGEGPSAGAHTWLEAEGSRISRSIPLRSCALRRLSSFFQNSSVKECLAARSSAGEDTLPEPVFDSDDGF